MRRIVFELNAFEDFCYWTEIDKSKSNKIKALIRDIIRSPFTGLGKPEPLNMNFKGTGRAESIMNIAWFMR